LWDYLKDHVYKNSTNSLDELKQNIRDCILNATTGFLHKFASNMRKEGFSCVAKRG
jgi:hypothetical protein